MGGGERGREEVLMVIEYCVGSVGEGEGKKGEVWEGEQW